MTITGTDLGTSFDDIVSIAVGSLNCVPIESSYVVGGRVSCELASGSQQAAGPANVVMTISTTGGNRMASSTQQFRLAVSRVLSVSPSFGPAAGGTMMRISGEELDIGNRDKTTVTLVMADGRRRRRRRRRQVLSNCIVQ